MVTVGLTGGIGSGKSTAAQYFKQIGAELLVADTLAKEILGSDPTVKKEVVSEFGREIYTTSGQLQREKLSHIVFSDRKALKKLNAIVHPRVISMMAERIAQLRSQRGVFIIEAALFYETGVDTMVEYVLVVEAGEEERIRRVMKRDQCRRKDVVQRMAMQLPTPRKVAKADFVLYNSGSEADLYQRCRFIYGLLQKIDLHKGRK